MPQLTNYRQDLSYLLGESSIPSTGTDNRDRFINDAIADIWNMKEWEWSKTMVTLPIVNGTMTLPSNTRQWGVKDVRIKSDTPVSDVVFDETTYEELPSFDTTQYKYAPSGDAETNYYVNLSITLASVGTVRYITKPPLLSASTDVSPIPNSMVVAKKALVYYRQGEDPQADTTIEEANFQKAIMEVMQLENRNKPIRRALGLQEANGMFTGNRS